MNRTKEKFKFGNNLEENAFTRYFSFSALYLAQGIPEGITYFAIPAWLAMNDKSALEIAAFVGVIGIPWSFKILVAPLMDRWTLLSMGRKRPWVILGQIGLILSFISIGLVPDPLNNLSGLMVAGFFISFFGAFQDVATDGMAVDVIPIDEQARANGLMWGTKLIGISLSLAAGTALINALGFSLAVSLLSISVALIMLVPIFFRERPGEKLMPWTKGEASPHSKKIQLRTWKEIFKNLYRVIKLPSSVIFGIGSVVIGCMFGLMDTLFPIFTIQELDWTNSEFSNVYSIMSIIGGILGMAIGGYLVDHFGKMKMLLIYLGILAGVIALFSFLNGWWANSYLTQAFILGYYTIYTFLCIAWFASAMHLCWKTVSATQFTLYMALSNMGRAAGSALVGVLEENFSWEYIFLIIAMVPVITAILVCFVKFQKHRDVVDSFDLVIEPLVAPPVMKT